MPTLLALSGLLGAALVLAVYYGVKPRITGPIGWMPPPPFRWAARVTGLSALPHGVQEGLSISAWVILGAAFLLACREAWANRLSVRAVLLCAVGLQILAVLAVPVRPSQDIYLYSIYGRIVSRYHSNPYVVPPRMFTRDALFPLVNRQWWDLTSPYGPAFIGLAARLARAFHRTADLVLAFKALAGTATLLTMLVVQRLATSIRPQRTAFALALIGLNPAVVMIGVGGGHNDALAGLAVALGLWLVVMRWDRDPRRRWITELSGTAVLTLGTLVKFPVGIVLILCVLVCALRLPPGWRTRGAAIHLLCVTGVAVVVALPFFNSRDPTLGVTTLSRFGGLLSPSSFLRSVTRSVASRVAGSVTTEGLSTVVLLLLPLVFLFVFTVLLSVVSGAPAIRTPSVLKAGPELLLGACGWAILLALLASSLMWPYYFAWAVPQAWTLPSLPRVALAVMSALLPVPLVLAGTSLPHEIVRDLQLYVIAPTLLVLLIFLLADLRRRVRTGTLLDREGPTDVVTDSDELRLDVRQRGLS